MNAVVDPSPQNAEVQFGAMTPAWLDSVLRVEQSAYAHPWTRGNFTDSLNAGYQAQVLWAAPHEVVGYFVALKGVDEVHLLNLTVAPAHQGQGWARQMLDGLALWARGQGVQWLWLEVRMSNLRAKSVYERYGFRKVGIRKAYYPAGGHGGISESGASRTSCSNGAREDALVMSLSLAVV